MDELEIKQKLDLLAEHQSQRDSISLQKQALIDKILTAEIKAKLAEIDAEFSDKTSAANEKIANLESEVKEAVKVLGSSVKANFLHAVWVKGHVSWDTKAMDGYAVGHPEILFMRKEGDPSVSLRKA